LEENEYNKNKVEKKGFIKKILSMKFSHIDMRLVAVAGVCSGLMVAKLWDPILSLDWYWYGILMIVFMIKPAMTSFRQLR